MNSPFAQILENLNGRHLERTEEQTLLEYVHSFESRLELARTVWEKEDEVLKQTIEEMKQRYPQFQGKHDKAWEKAYRDMQLVIRYNVQGLLCDDVDMAAEKLIVWLRTILTSNGMSGEFLADIYVHLWQNLERHLSTEYYSMLEPYLEKTTAVFRGSEEPALAGV